MPKATDERTTRKTTGAKPATKPAARKSRKRADPEMRLTSDRLIVHVPGATERRSAGGLLIPATAAPAPRRLQWGDVVLVGPDVRVAKAGDRVLFLPQSALELEVDGEEQVLLRERDIQAVRSPEHDEVRAPGQYL